jgi:hypothetical protein
MILPSNKAGLLSRAAAGLGLAATPTFAVLALLTGSTGPDMLCLHAMPSLGGMSLMYWLMSGFHLAPWLRLIAKRRRVQPSHP